MSLYKDCPTIGISRWIAPSSLPTRIDSAMRKRCSRPTGRTASFTTAQFCQPYIMESMPVEKALEAKSIPTLRIETDYSMEDVGQLKTRVEAFIEQLK